MLLIVGVPQPNVWYSMEHTDGKNAIYSNKIDENIALKLPGTTLFYDENLKSTAANFSHSNSGIIIDQFNKTCLTNPSQCVDGFTLSFWIKWIKPTKEFIFSSQSFNMEHFTNSVIPIEVWNGTHSWSIFHNTKPILNRTKDGSNRDWHFYTIQWNKTCLSVYINATFNEEGCDTREYSILMSETPIKDRFAIGTSSYVRRLLTAVGVIIDNVRIWNLNLSQTALNELLLTGNLIL